MESNIHTSPLCRLDPMQSLFSFYAQFYWLEDVLRAFISRIPVEILQSPLDGSMGRPENEDGRATGWLLPGQISLGLTGAPESRGGIAEDYLVEE
jgi:hypothetical protein